MTRDDEGEEEDPDGEEDQTEQGSKAVGLLQQDEDLNEVDSVILDYEDEGVLETDTSEVDLPLPPPPPGFGFAPIPSTFNVSKLLKRKVLWVVEYDRHGSRNWIISQIASGPPDPRSAAQGVTFQLKCSKRLDQITQVDSVARI